MSPQVVYMRTLSKVTYFLSVYITYYTCLWIIFCTVLWSFKRRKYHVGDLYPIMLTTKPTRNQNIFLQVTQFTRNWNERRFVSHLSYLQNKFNEINRPPWNLIINRAKPGNGISFNFVWKRTVCCVSSPSKYIFRFKIPATSQRRRINVYGIKGRIRV